VQLRSLAVTRKTHTRNTSSTGGKGEMGLPNPSLPLQCCMGCSGNPTVAAPPCPAPASATGTDRQPHHSSHSFTAGEGHTYLSMIFRPAAYLQAFGGCLWSP